ncbi:MAG: (Fe-S)-binding protein [Nitrospirae bacterium]|nr:MAG: (Fe-S)-binding protein [Nitrospirota bacterium]
MNKGQLIELTRECVLCGRCKAKCPTYQLLCNESFGPRGRMHLAEALLKGDISASQRLKERLLSCTLCGACEKTCPKSARVPWVMASLRQDLKIDSFSRILAKWAFKHPRSAYNVSRILYYPLKKGLIKKAIIPADSPLFEYSPLEWGDVFTPPKATEPRGRIVLFSGCAVRFVFSYLAEALIRICTLSGYEVVLPKSEFCCGAPLLGMGLQRDAEKLAKKNIQYLGALKADMMVSLCPTCVHTMRNLYPDLTGKTIDIVDSTEALTRLINEVPLKEQKGTVVYHHPCHDLYGLNIKKEPIDLILKTGLTVTELPEGCCGFAGGFSLRFPELSQALLEERFKGMNKESITLATSCPGCIYQFMKTLPQGRVVHLVEVIEESLDEEGR